MVTRGFLAEQSNTDCYVEAAAAYREPFDPSSDRLLHHRINVDVALVAAKGENEQTSADQKHPTAATSMRSLQT